MDIKKGIAVSSGVVVCRAWLLSDDELHIDRREIAPSEIPAERKRLLKAVAASSDDLRDLRDKTTRSLGKETGAIFDYHLGLLNDQHLLGEFSSRIENQRFSAEYAVRRTLRDFSKAFFDQPDPLFKDRVKDVYDLERRLLIKLMGKGRMRLAGVKEPVVLVAKDLTPSQTANLDKNIVRAIAIEAGGQTSHTAIIANSMGIPAVVGVQDLVRDVSSGDLLIVNGYSGVVIVNPDEATVSEHRLYEQRQMRFETRLDQMRDLPAVTRDGTPIELLGNIEFPSEVDNALHKGAQGIGLYRTEFLYLASDKEPTEEDHYNAYASVAEKLKGKPLIIRTLDLGADKFWPHGEKMIEDNPFLGCRSIRLCLANHRIFKVQLRAILRASILGDVRIMFPMISSPMELKQAHMLLKDAMDECYELGVPFRRDIPVGIMIEVPAAALMANVLAREVNFFSIGTNDLIQYTLAVDRGNQRVATLFTAAHPAVLALLRDVMRVSRKRKISTSICGEMGGDPQFTIFLVGLGLRSLSITPHNIPKIKQVLRNITIKDAEKIARRVMSFEQPQQILNFLNDETRKVLPDIFSEEPLPLLTPAGAAAGS
ncbi:MAG: phosphoenolpyruvate--protein phosphotransferase [Phycisphaerae bacterium]